MRATLNFKELTPEAKEVIHARTNFALAEALPVEIPNVNLPTGDPLATAKAKAATAATNAAVDATNNALKQQTDVNLPWTTTGTVSVITAVVTTIFNLLGANIPGWSQSSTNKIKEEAAALSAQRSQQVQFIHEALSLKDPADRKAYLELLLRLGLLTPVSKNPLSTSSEVQKGKPVIILADGTRMDIPVGDLPPTPKNNGVVLGNNPNVSPIVKVPPGVKAPPGVKVPGQ